MQSRKDLVAKEYIGGTGFRMTKDSLAESMESVASLEALALNSPP